jgi:hypothetical protein
MTRGKIDPGQNESRSPKTQLPKAELSRHLRRKIKGQTELPNVVMPDEGRAALAGFYGTADDGYQAINRSWTVVWLRHRLREYVNVHGYASAGVCALLERAAEQYADGDFLRATVASSGSRDIAEGLHQAARHAQLARSHELAAWELAAREGAAKKAIEGAGISGQTNRNGKLALAIRETAGEGVYEGQQWGGHGADDLPPIPTGETPPVPYGVPAKSKGKRGGRRVPATIGDAVPTFRSPPPVKAEGTISPSPLSQTNSPSPPPKPPLYSYCERCSRNHLGVVCPRCGPACVTPSEGVTVAEEDAHG